MIYRCNEKSYKNLDGFFYRNMFENPKILHKTTPLLLEGVLLNTGAAILTMLGGSSSITLALGRWSQKNQVFKARFSHIVSSRPF